MAKCKFCYLLPNGDIPTDRESLIYQKDVLIPFYGHIENDDLGSCIYTSFHGTIIADFDVQIFKEKDKWVMGFAGWRRGDSSNWFLNKLKRIKYCPMCGRKLN